jgi:hypothetical protein
VGLPWAIAMAVVDERAISVLGDLPEENADGCAISDRLGIDGLRRGGRP